MKTLTFEVTVTFTDNIKDGEIQEVTDNLSNAIYDSVTRGHGISPEESIAVTKSITVRETLTGIETDSVIF